MFGYVKPFVPDLRVCEHELYKALYCGLCRSMGRHTGCSSRFALSYDFVFLAAVRAALSGEPIHCSVSGCFVHPIRKRPMAEDSPALEYSARAAAVLTLEKIRDDISDRHGAGKVVSGSLIPAAKRMVNKAYPTGGPGDNVRTALRELAELEQEQCPSLDLTADCFGKLLGDIFAYGIDDMANRRIAYAAGHATGRFIYVADAADDLEDDRKGGSYNPLIFSPMSKSALSTAIRLDLNKLAAAIELIDFNGKPELCGIIKNIVYKGMPAEADRILTKDNTRKDAGSDERSL